MNDHDDRCRACAGDGSIYCCDLYEDWRYWVDGGDLPTGCGRCDTSGIADCLTCRGTGRAR